MCLPLTHSHYRLEKELRRREESRGKDPEFLQEREKKTRKQRQQETEGSDSSSQQYRCYLKNYSLNYSVLAFIFSLA